MTNNDLAQAIDNARPLAATLRLVEAKLHALDQVHHYHAAAALKEQIADLEGDIRGLADRGGIDPLALRELLAVEHDLRMSYRRRPPRGMLEKALGRAAGDAERALHDAHQLASDAQQALQRATRKSVALAAANLAYGAGC